jgi:hypothetical protein
MSTLEGVGTRLKILSLGRLTTVMIMEVCNYFVSNFLCRVADFVDDK